MSLVSSKVNEPAIVILIIHLAYIYTQILHLPFIKPHLNKFLKWLSQ